MMHIMLDIETWGIKPFSVITEIGAVAFDIEAPGKVIDSFTVSIDPSDAMKVGLRVDAETIQWWMDEKQKLALDFWRKSEKVSLSLALDSFEDWLTQCSPLHDFAIWGNGIMFDNALLGQAYQAAQRSQPWSYIHDYDFRTIKALDRKGLLKPDIDRSLTKHTALGDALWQAHYLQNIVDHFGLEF